jgi:hypothetical protein
MLVCRICNIEKPNTSFATKRDNTSGKDTRCTQCKIIENKKWREENRDRWLLTEAKRMTRRRARVRETLAELRREMGGSCTNCGYDSYIEVLDFHHLRDKQFGLARAASERTGPEAIREEASKCILLCRNCHQLYHTLGYMPRIRCVITKLSA